MRLPWSLTVPAWAKQLQLKPVLCLGGCWHPGWLILGGKGNCANTVCRRFFKTLPATGQSSQLWAQLLPERNPAQPTGAAHQWQRHRVFCHRAWGWHSLRAPSLGSRSRRVTKTRVKREGSFSRRQRWCGTYLGCFGAPSKALIRLYPEGNLCQLSGHSVRTAVTSPGCRDLPSTPMPSLQSTPGPPSQLPVLHHPAPDGFPQAVTTHLVSPRTCRSPVTFSGVFVLIKATPEATGYLPCLSADLHTLTTAQPTRGAGCGPRHIRITTDQRRRSQSFSPVIVGSADKHQK